MKHLTTGLGCSDVPMVHCSLKLGPAFDASAGLEASGAAWDSAAALCSGPVAA